MTLITEFNQEEKLKFQKVVILVFCLCIHIRVIGSDSFIHCPFCCGDASFLGLVAVLCLCLTPPALDGGDWLEASCALGLCWCSSSSCGEGLVAEFSRSGSFADVVIWRLGCWGCWSMIGEDVSWSSSSWFCGGFSVTCFNWIIGGSRRSGSSGSCGLSCAW